ncbi:Aste57867_11035 [Aphanomyces stellatus]|uniref:Aste57867_11035 protein n=1 Tax=Aphanomyces stellatus TaxID=120398 RepID=A0A485KSB5_9STRA|nr:hypothetical protein As57867_010993 [Aphanomyces stellatus]VFT87903.1 Aste57867_11035 [Aphanomyces stellatus]
MGKSSDEADSERSPLLRAMRNSYQEETVYSSIHNANMSYSSQRDVDEGTLRGMNVFRPIVYAEQSLGFLLNGVMVYVFCCFVGFALISFNADGILGPPQHWNWWLVFLPFWIGNLVMFFAHILSMRAATKLRQWAETDIVSNEPLLPLLRKILLLYAVSMPLCLLLLWAELAFCALLSNSTDSVSVYVAYAPILILELSYIVRYFLCKSRTPLPGASWILVFAFTAMLAYNSDIIYRASKESPRPAAADVNALLLPWLAVFSPLFALQLLLFGSLIAVLYSEVVGYYKMLPSQVGAAILYTLSLAAGAMGQVVLVEKMEFQATRMDVPSILLFSAWLTGSFGLYIVCRLEVSKLMASRGGAVPVPLTRTADGWVTNHAVTDRWILLGDIPLTDAGRDRRAGQRKRTASDVESEMNSEGFTWLRNLCGTSWLRWCCCLGSSSKQSFDAVSSDEHPENRLKNVKRRNSGSYSDLMVDIETK